MSRALFSFGEDQQAAVGLGIVRDAATVGAEDSSAGVPARGAGDGPRHRSPAAQRIEGALGPRRSAGRDALHEPASSGRPSAGPTASMVSATELRPLGPVSGSRRCPPRGPSHFSKGLILAQNERWRRGLGMQVERVQQCTSGGRVSKATATNPEDGYSRGKLRVIPSEATASASTPRQRIRPPRDGPSWY